MLDGEVRLLAEFAELQFGQTERERHLPALVGQDRGSAGGVRRTRRSLRLPVRAALLLLDGLIGLIQLQLGECDARRELESSASCYALDVAARFADGYSRVWVRFASRMEFEMNKLEFLAQQA